MDNGLMKVRGRLIQDEILESQKHSIVLPKNHHVTKLIIRDEHLNRLLGYELTNLDTSIIYLLSSMWLPAAISI